MEKNLDDIPRIDIVGTDGGLARNRKK